MSAEDYVQRAFTYFKGFSEDHYLNCCQSIIATFADHTPIEKEAFIKLGTGFGGGFAGIGETCGVLIGGILAISAINGVTGEEDYLEFKELKKSCKEAVRDYYFWLHKSNSRIKCADIIGIETTTEEGMKEYAHLKQKGTVPCYRIIRSAVKYLYKTLLSNNSSPE